MIKKIAAISAITLILTTCSSPASANLIKNSDIKYISQNNISLISNNKPLDTMLTKQYLKDKALIENASKIANVLDQLKARVGKTWYVFSGNTPAGWDCSGLTMWFYEQLGITLEHRASKQQDSGIETSDPKPGDIVVFKYKGYTSAYHVGIYIGNGLMIHAPRKGEVTRIESVDQFGGNYSNISYRSLIQTL